MPSKNSIKIYSEDSYYHIYNRGVEKRIIFQEEQDYYVLLYYLKEYLLPKDEAELRSKLVDPNTSYKEKYRVIRLLRLRNFSDEITLIAYCLMPNHVHLLVKQKSLNGIDRFMRSLGTRYGMYFNSKYKRVGQLFQDVYKAVLVESDEQLLCLTGYIHRNPLNESLPAASLRLRDLSDLRSSGVSRKAGQVLLSVHPRSKLRGILAQNKIATKGESLQGYFSQPSSYPEYLGHRETDWVHPEIVLPYFSKTNPNLSYQSFVEQIDDYSSVQHFIID